MVENMTARLYAKSKGVFLWQVAKAMGISEPTLYIRLRVKFTQEQEKEFAEAVDKASKGG